MYTFIGMKGELFQIHDSSDSTVDELSIHQLEDAINLGIEILGITDVETVTEDDGDDEIYGTGRPSETEIETDDLGFDFDIEDEDYSEDTSLTNKLLGFYNEYQVALFKKYYKWLSRRTFQNERGHLKLYIASSDYLQQKKVHLTELRNDSTWEYNGFEDLGYRGAGKCTLGHPLRYMHYAVSENMEQLVFGEKCMSDFFEVDKATLRALRYVQRQCEDDISLLEDEYSNSRGLYDGTISRFQTLDKVLSNKKFADRIDETMLSFYYEFKGLQMIYPKSLVRLIKSQIITVVKPTYEEIRLIIKSVVNSDTDYNAILNRFKNIKDFVNFSREGFSKYGRLQYNSILLAYLLEVFGVDIDGIYRYEPNEKKNSEELRTSKKMIAYYKDFRRAIGFSHPSKNFWNFNKSTINYENAVILINFHAKYEEIYEYCISHSLFLYINNPSVSDKSNEVLTLLKSGFTTTRFLTHFNNSLSEAYSWVLNVRPLIDDAIKAKELKQHTVSNEEPDLMGILDYCSEALSDDKVLARMRITNSFNLEVYSTVSIKKTATDRQMFYISSLYKAIKTHMDTGGVTVERPSDEETNPLMERVAKFMKLDYIKVQGAMGISRANFAISVCETVQKSGRCSEKQQQVLENAFKNFDL